MPCWPSVRFSIITKSGDTETDLQDIVVGAGGVFNAPR